MVYTIGKAAEELGVSIQTLRAWEKSGKIKAFRTPGRQRLFSEEEVRRLKGLSPKKGRKAYCYARVSTKAQSDDLERQVEVLETFCIAKGWEHKVITDIGSGLKCDKPGLNKLIDAILDGEVSVLVLNYRDRLLRFGDEIIFRLCKKMGTEVVIINETENKTYEQELTEDVLSVITIFSAKLYGSRSHKAQKMVAEFKKELKE